MTRLGQTLAHLEARWFGLIRSLFHVVWTHLLSCSGGAGNNRRYRQLKPAASTSAATSSPADEGPEAVNVTVEAEPEEVLSLKISLLGDCQIGKTSFMVLETPNSDTD